MLGKGKGCLDCITITTGSLFFHSHGAQTLKNSHAGGFCWKWRVRITPVPAEPRAAKSLLLTQPQVACWLVSSSPGTDTQQPHGCCPHPQAPRDTHPSRGWGWEEEEEVEPQKEYLWCAILCSHERYVADSMEQPQFWFCPR